MSNQLSYATLESVSGEAYSAYLKHNEHSVFNPEMPPLEKLAILVEEVGEVAHELTYDTDDSLENLRSELIQVASVALTWYESLRN